MLNRMIAIGLSGIGEEIKKLLFRFPKNEKKENTKKFMKFLAVVVLYSFILE